MAAPSTAGAVTRIRSTPSITPSTRLDDERGVSRTANRTSGRLKTSQRAKQETEDQQDDQPRPVDHAGSRQHPADGSQHRLGRLDQERRDPVAPGRIHPGHQHSAEYQRPQGEEQELQEIDEECDAHAIESTKSVARGPAAVRSPGSPPSPVIVVVIVSLAE